MTVKDDTLKYNFFEFQGYKTDHEMDKYFGDYSVDELWGYKYGTSYSRRMKEKSIRDSLLFISFMIFIIISARFILEKEKRFMRTWEEFVETDL